MAKSIEIKPLSSGEFEILFPDGETWNCVDGDSVGENMEAAIWPIIKPALDERKHIILTIEDGTETI